MRFQRKPATVEAAQVTQDLTLSDGTVIPAGQWLVIRDGGQATAVVDAVFQEEFEPVPAVEQPADPPAADEPESTDAPAPQ
jgi:hypothetical protein